MELIKSNPQKWLEQNYERHNVATLAIMLNVTVNCIESMLLMMGVDINLTEAQKNFVLQFYDERTVCEIVHELSIADKPDYLLRKKVIHFIKSKGLKKDYVPEIKRQPIKRVPPDHTNINHSDRVEKWANMSLKEIKSHKGRIIY